MSFEIGEPFRGREKLICSDCGRPFWAIGQGHGRTPHPQARVGMTPDQLARWRDGK
jgi:hypothetical protein